MSGFLRRIFAPLVLGGGVGRRGEAAAARFLQGQRYKVLARNLRNRFGEVDLLAIAPDARTVVIAEVKTSVEPHPGRRAELRVDFHKQRKLNALAAQIARRYRLTDRPIRFDILGVDLPPGQPPRVRHFPGAFESMV